MKTLYLIPARGGSKGVPGKNIKKLNGKPLIGYTIDAARAVSEDTHICVSTDSIQIAKTVETYGLHVPFLRPAELATDTAGSHDVVIHALDHYKSQGINYDTVALLQPTSPFRTGVHLRDAINLYSPDIDMLVSVQESRLHPHFNLLKENVHGYLERLTNNTCERRQDCPPVFAYNGAIYIINANSIRHRRLHKLEKVKKYQMQEIDSLDIDTQLDWLIAEVCMANRNAPLK